MGRIGLIIAGLMVAFAVIAPMQVSGDAEYDHSTPGDGEVVRRRQLSLTSTSRRMLPQAANSFLNVVNSSNVDVDLNNGVVDAGDHTHMSYRAARRTAGRELHRPLANAGGGRWSTLKKAIFLRRWWSSVALHWS